MRRWRRAAVGTTLACAAAACNLTLHDVREPDAGDDGSIASPPDANQEAGPCSAPPTSWCQSHGPHAFCADFDENGLNVGLELSDAAASQTIAATSDSFVSPCFSARFAIPPFADSGFEMAQASFNLPIAQPSTIALAFDLRIERLAAGSSLNLVYLGTGEGSPDLYIQVSGVDGQTASASVGQENAGPAPHVSWTAPLPIGAWVRLTIDVTLAPSHAVMTMTPTGGAPLTVFDGDMSAPWVKAYPGFSLGIPYAGTPTSGASVLVDDLTFDAK
jgi:hypothetical protein